MDTFVDKLIARRTLYDPRFSRVAAQLRRGRTLGLNGPRMFDDVANFAYGTIASITGSPTTGTAITVTSTATWPAVPFNATIHATGATEAQVASGGEIVRVTALTSGNPSTIVRATEGPNAARSIVAGDIIKSGVTAKTLTDLAFPTTNYLRSFAVQEPVSGKFIVARVPGVATGQGMNTLADGTCFALPIVISADCTVAQIGCGWHSTGSAGALARLGIYLDDGTFYPGSLLVDAGTMATTSSNLGNITISQALKKRTVYWAVMAYQGAPASVANIKASTSSSGPYLNGQLPFEGEITSQDTIHNCTIGWFYAPGITGAFPGTFPAKNTLGGYYNAPVITITVA